MAASAVLPDFFGAENIISGYGSLPSSVKVTAPEEFNLRWVPLEGSPGFRVAQDFGDEGHRIALPSRQGLCRTVSLIGHGNAPLRHAGGFWGVSPPPAASASLAFN